MGERSDEVRYNDLPDDSTFQSDSSVSSTDDTAVIRSDIEQTRAEMSETIEAIQERLNPQRLTEQVKDQVREQFEEAKTTVKDQVREQFEEAKATVRDATIGKAETMVRNVGDTVSDARYTIMDTIRENPIPAALVGIGLGWLFMNARNTSTHRSRSYRSEYYGDIYRGQTYDRQSGYTAGTYATGARGYNEPNVIERGQHAVGNTLQQAQEKAGDVASKVQQTVGNLADQGQATVSNVVDQAQSTVGNIADQAQYQAQRVEDRFQTALIENPLVVGAISLAVGAAVGLAAPQTRREHELMGEARDNLVERVQSVAQDTVEKVQQVAGQVVEQTETTIKEQAREQGLTNG